MILTDRDLAALSKVAQTSMSWTCQLSRAVVGAADDYGQKTVASWQPHPTVPNSVCAVRQTEAVSENQTSTADYVLDTYTLRLPLGLDVQVSDRVEKIFTRSGSEFDTSVKYYDIREKMPNQTQLVFLLRAVR